MQSIKDTVKGKFLDLSSLDIGKMKCWKKCMFDPQVPFVRLSETCF